MKTAGPVSFQSFLRRLLSALLTPDGDCHAAGNDKGAGNRTREVRIHVVWRDVVEALRRLATEGNDERELAILLDSSH